jgi:myosin-5
MLVCDSKLCVFVGAHGLQAKQQQLVQERRKQEEEKLLAALASPMGFHKGKPLAALVVFRACLQWRAFQADRTSVFDRIIQVRADNLRG